MNRNYKFDSLFGVICILLLFCQLRPAKPKLTVYVFLSTECPISQQYVRALEDLHLRFRASGVQFVAMFPLRTDSPRLIRRFQTEYHLSFACRPDISARLARQLRVHTTPEVVVMQADGAVRYQGAIDDWYVALANAVLRHRMPIYRMHSMRFSKIK